MKRVIAGTFMATVFAVGLSAQATSRTTAEPAGDEGSKDAAKNDHSRPGI